MTTKITSDNIDATIGKGTDVDNNAFNIGLLGFKMAVNEGLTVFNLVDGVVDEFNDESGTDESEGSNDLYCGTSDYYINNSTPDGNPVGPYSAGFSLTTITEPDTSVAGTNPAQGSGTWGTFTVPSGVPSVQISVWGAGGGQGGPGPAPGACGAGGGGGFTSGTLAVTPGQTLYIGVGEGGSSAGQAGPNDSFLNGGEAGPNNPFNQYGGSGGGLSGVFDANLVPLSSPQYSAPQAYIVAGSGGSGAPGANDPGATAATNPYRIGGAGGGLVGDAGGQTTEQTAATPFIGGGGGDQEQGGQGAGPVATPGSLFRGGDAVCRNDSTGGVAGGAGYYGGAGTSKSGPGAGGDPIGYGGGGSSYHGHPQITCGSTEEGAAAEGGGTADPNYVASTNEGSPGVGGVGTPGEDGYILLTACQAGSVTSTTIVSTAFSSTSVPTNSRIVVFEENVDTPTLNTDIIASVSRDGGTTYTNATLADSGYVTGSSGQRILTGQADISGQPSGQSMRWKLALANNTVKIHGVSLQWS